jgi:hypothetical protein
MWQKQVILGLATNREMPYKPYQAERLKNPFKVWLILQVWNDNEGS